MTYRDKFAHQALASLSIGYGDGIDLVLENSAIGDPAPGAEPIYSLNAYSQKDGDLVGYRSTGASPSNRADLATEASEFARAILKALAPLGTATTPAEWVAPDAAREGLQPYAITFGVQYGLYPREPHPAFPDIDVSRGYLVIWAPSRELARKLATLVCGETSPGVGRWAFDYELRELQASEQQRIDQGLVPFFPLGAFAELELSMMMLVT